MLVKEKHFGKERKYEFDMMIKYYRYPGLSDCSNQETLSKLQRISTRVTSLATETCVYIELNEGCQLSTQDEKKLLWVLILPFDEKNISKSSFLDNKLVQEPKHQCVALEIGPRLNFSTAWSTNAVSICHAVGLHHVKRIEKSLRYLVALDSRNNSTAPIDYDEELKESLASVLYDKMTQCIYGEPLDSFDVQIKPDQWFEVDILSKGRSALEIVNDDLGLAFDDWDLDYYTKLFSEQLERNPTSVECFDLAQSNSEHSRHWFFRGKISIDGEEIQESLMDMVKKTDSFSNDNSVIRLTDNSRYVLPAKCDEGVKKYHTIMH